MDALDAKPFRLSQYRRAVVVLNVFATWSDKCRAQQPVLNEFALAHPDDTAVFGITYHEDDREVRAYRKELAVPYPIAMERRHDSLLAIFENQNVVVPTTIVLRPGGTLSCAWTGERDRDWFERERDYALASSP
ncbi:MAG: TlpA family protein disulfide reductase [Candidatus Eremiobacteraeota bacterium]|nr:TlpA family protein disulfide reductase [Candidatus Eremiobacteraeota bacterium]